MTDRYLYLCVFMCTFVKSSVMTCQVRVMWSSGPPSNQLAGHVTTPQVRVMCTLNICQHLLPVPDRLSTLYINTLHDVVEKIQQQQSKLIFQFQQQQNKLKAHLAGVVASLIPSLRATSLPNLVVQMW